MVKSYGKNPMKNWEACVRTWEKNNDETVSVKKTWGRQEISNEELIKSAQNLSRRIEWVQESSPGEAEAAQARG
jgi:hypothetical protein